MTTFSVWRPIPDHFVWMRLYEGPVMTTQPGYIQKWFQLFGSFIDDGFGAGDENAHSIGGNNIAAIFAPGQTDEEDADSEEEPDESLLLVSSFTEAEEAERPEE